MIQSSEIDALILESFFDGSFDNCVPMLEVILQVSDCTEPAWKEVFKYDCADSSINSPNDTVEDGAEKEKTNHESSGKDGDAGNENLDDSTDEEIGDLGSDNSEGADAGDGAGNGDDDSSEDEEFALDDEDTEDDDTDDDEDSDLDEEEDEEVAADAQKVMQTRKVSVRGTKGDTTESKNDSVVVNISGSGEKSVLVTTATEKRKIEEDDGDDTSTDANAKKQKLED